MFKRVLVINRGEIAMRVLQTCRRLGIDAYLASSQADLESLPARSYDRTICIGPAQSDGSYLNQDAILATAQALSCDAVHPGYGFLAENADFADACTEAGVTFIGPRPQMLRLFGDKVAARTAAMEAGLPVAPGSPLVTDLSAAVTAAEQLGYPVMLKSAKGGGGKGMRIVDDARQLEEVFELAQAEAEAAFGDGGVYVERWIDRARHVEVQIVASRFGEVIHVGDRDCSVQRRNQKLVEEAPAPFIEPDMQERIRRAAVQLCDHVGYDNVGTVEFLLDTDRDEFYFLEVNARIQVEHGVSELISGLDIVEMQIRSSADERLDMSQDDVKFVGSALQCRLNAEDPTENFRPSPGRLKRWKLPERQNIRIDTHCYDGYFVPPYYDSLIGKVMSHGKDRDQAIRLMDDALEDAEIEGIDTTKDFAQWVIGHPDFRDGSITTRWLDLHLLDGSWIHQGSPTSSIDHRKVQD